MEGVRLLDTDDPENVDSWKVIANQETFDNLPACWIRDSINGGGYGILRNLMDLFMYLCSLVRQTQQLV